MFAPDLSHGAYSLAAVAVTLLSQWAYGRYAAPATGAVKSVPMTTPPVAQPVQTAAPAHPLLELIVGTLSGHALDATQGALSTGLKAVALQLVGVAVQAVAAAHAQQAPVSPAAPK